MARKRQHMSRSQSKRDFRRKSFVHPRNQATSPMRGGIRL